MSNEKEEWVVGEIYYNRHNNKKIVIESKQYQDNGIELWKAYILGTDGKKTNGTKWYSIYDRKHWESMKTQYTMYMNEGQLTAKLPILTLIESMRGSLDALEGDLENNRDENKHFTLEEWIEFCKYDWEETFEISKGEE